MFVHIASGELSQELVHEFGTLDYTWPSAEVRQEAIDNQTYIPENNAPSGLKVRWPEGINVCLPASRSCQFHSKTDTDPGCFRFTKA